MKKEMRALVRSSEAEKMSLTNIEVPEAQSGQVLVEMKVSAVNEMDVQVRSGGWARYVKKFLVRSAVVTGFEFSGIARSDGKRIKSGDRIMGYVHVLKGPRCHAEFAWIDENDICAIPSHWSFNDAAALVLMGLTAVDILEMVKPMKQEGRIAIIGAAGGVGAYTLQLAKYQGFHVTAICSEKSAEWVKDLGADTVRPYNNQQKYKGGDAFDLIVDVPCKSSFSEARPFLKSGGMYVNTNPLNDLWGYALAAFSSRKAGYLMMLSTTPTKLMRLIELVELGAMRPIIDSSYSLSKADDAFDRYAKPGKQGRILLEISK